MWMGDNRVILGKFPEFLRLDAILISLLFLAYPIVSTPPGEEDGRTQSFYSGKIRPIAFMPTGLKHVFMGVRMITKLGIVLLPRTP